MNEPIHRTVFQVEVFSRGRFVLPDEGVDDDPFDLIGINEAITTGDCIGMVTMENEEVIPESDLQEHLTRIGNDGSFFDPID